MPRASRQFATATLALTLASQAAWAEDVAPESEPDHAGYPTKIVGIAPTRLLPTVLVVPHTSAFGWLNYSSFDATIKFDEDITSKLTCRSPGLFRASAGDLASPRVASGAFVTLCSLAPGEYDYHLELEERQQPLLGKLVVEPRAYLAGSRPSGHPESGYGDPAPRSQVAVHSIPSPLLRHCHPSTASARAVRSGTVGSWEGRAIKIVR